MKTLLVSISMAVAMVSLGLGSTDADAARLGRGRPAGMQRQMPAKPADATPAKPAATPGNPQAAPGAAAANAGKRSWLGPIAGLAAGLGLAALFSHFGMGEGFANVVMMVLLAAMAFVAIRWLMQRFAGTGARRPAAGGLQYAAAGSAVGGVTGAGLGDAAQPMQRSALDVASGASPATASAAAPQASAPTLPDGIANADFERLAKMVFIRLQAANDSCLVDDLRKFTTPELFASLQADLLERGNATQKTDVLQLDAKVVDTAEQDGQHIVTVRFQGLIREAADAGAEPFDELWHLVRPADASRDWAIAGIAPTQ